MVSTSVHGSGRAVLTSLAHLELMCYAPRAKYDFEGVRPHLGQGVMSDSDPPSGPLERGAGHDPIRRLAKRLSLSLTALVGFVGPPLGLLIDLTGFLAPFIGLSLTTLGLAAALILIVVVGREIRHHGQVRRRTRAPTKTVPIALVVLLVLAIASIGSGAFVLIRFSPPVHSSKQGFTQSTGPSTNSAQSMATSSVPPTSSMLPTSVSASSSIGVTTDVPTSAPSTTRQAATIEVKPPLEGAAVPVRRDVHFAAGGMQEFDEVWILIRYEGNKTQRPQGKCDRKDSACYRVQFGDGPDRIGTEYIFTLLIVTAEDAQILNSKYGTGFEMTAPPITPLARSGEVRVQRCKLAGEDACLAG